VLHTLTTMTHSGNSISP